VSTRRRSSTRRPRLTSSPIKKSPRRSRLFLRGHLRVGIPPRTELQAAAHPTQAFRGDRCALLAADDAARRFLHPVRLNGKTSLLDEDVGGHRLEGGRSRQRHFSFLFHFSTISSAGQNASVRQRVPGA